MQKYILIIFSLFVIHFSLFAEKEYLHLSSPNNGWSTARVITVKGETNVPVKTVSLVYNGVAFVLPVNGGRFERNFVASPGMNVIHAEIVSETSVLRDQISFFSKAPAKAMKILLVWDTDGTDLDLWVLEPSGEKCFYGYRNTKIGGSLDVDVTNGFGPEVYTLANPTPGNYTIQINYFADRGIPQTQCHIYVVTNEGSPNEMLKEYEVMLTKTGEIVTVDIITLE